MFRKQLESNILAVNTVHTSVFAWFCVKFTIVQTGSYNGKFTPVKILDWALVQWQNVAIWEYKNAKILTSKICESFQ